jgi:hypothetical protein
MGESEFQIEQSFLFNSKRIYILETNFKFEANPRKKHNQNASKRIHLF